MHSYIAELTGSFFLVLALGLTGDPLASGLLIIGIVSTGRYFSGAHFNPAVTLSFWAAGKLSGREFWLTVLSQTAGAVAGCLLILAMAGAVFRILPAAAATPFQYSAVELLFGFLLSMLYLVLSVSHGPRRIPLEGVVIGLAYAGMLMVGEPVSGGVFNPAAALGASFVDFMSHGDSFVYLPAFVLGPLTGGLVAGILLSFLPKRDESSPEAA